MEARWPLILLIPLAFIVGWFGISRHAREQTAFLERVAEALEHAQAIPPETEHAIQNTIASVRWRAFPADEKLEMRQNYAIGRIEAVLAAKAAPTTGNVASRELPRYLPSE
jgi:thioesterase domain-containing protein